MTPTWAAPTDPDGAFVDGPRVLVAGRPDGALAPARLAVKDVFDVAGRVTGAGNPTYAAASSPATHTAAAVELLVDAGATVIGRTVTDELAYSLDGSNVHLGTPRNAAWPGHLPGGSSAGSAAAVAAGVADIGLGTDTGGSIRVPASYCRLLGWRPTHGLVPVTGLVPLSPSFDTVGLLVRSGQGELLATAANALGARSSRPFELRGVIVADELLALLTPQDATSVMQAAQTFAACHGVSLEVRSVLPVAPSDAATAFRRLQGAEAWRIHGARVTAGLGLGPGIAARFAAASEVTADDVDEAAACRALVRAAFEDATADGFVMVQPAASGPPPSLDDHDAATKAARRAATLAITAPAGLTGAPVVVAPTRASGQPPLGIAFVGARGDDAALLALVGEWNEREERDRGHR